MHMAHNELPVRMETYPVLPSTGVALGMERDWNTHFGVGVIKHRNCGGHASQFLQLLKTELEWDLVPPMCVFKVTESICPQKPVYDVHTNFIQNIAKWK